MMQGPGGAGLKGPTTALQGGTITVEVVTSDAFVQVSAGAPGDALHFRVPTDRTVVIPVPAVPPGTILQISVGRGLRRRAILVEVVALAP